MRKLFIIFFIFSTIFIYGCKDDKTININGIWKHVVSENWKVGNIICDDIRIFNNGNYEYYDEYKLLHSRGIYYISDNKLVSYPTTLSYEDVEKYGLIF